MKAKQLLLTTFAMALSVNIWASGLEQISSNHSVDQTTENLVKELNKLKDKGVRVFTVIDHMDNAKNVGLKLPPTKLVIFGNPNVGTKLMQCAHTTAIDLPQKYLVYQNKSGQTVITYNNPRYLAERHQMKGCEAVIGKIQGLLAGVAKKAAAK
ncbi:DUF302 domain-containing protein [Endozoicomonas sp. SM1973]|uniref:DUF302 domain-containing protein n=1 Tax=Spartinivicinus marinus TaxID=2994442 RepID=A0A853I789_9GAMM|nr:DUF302 domain-containing protein [Spartinivicinus marinus]MCX4025788.1 DUF302 domain-containing protein [Spartinivicinus marinus]NYZ65781.1 DUF302 domain-containing protein [Spartinivicinus marinus]